ncbi:8165_t:CDS:2, partial [Cetraspora pellucida]
IEKTTNSKNINSLSPFLYNGKINKSESDKTEKEEYKTGIKTIANNSDIYGCIHNQVTVFIDNWVAQEL